MAVTINPLPQWSRELPERLRPMHPPIFGIDTPTADDIELARELFAALDPESRRWYGEPKWLIG